mmetsp:Transcript_32894/g.73903  ORF Transcript_32894/g.73903 Transcript_32894/m.73903 type:complete len:320 (-) Transcript_32894:22-981(-)
MHLNSEDLAFAWGTRSVSGHEDNILSGVDDTLLDTSSQHVTNTLDLVDARDGAAHGGIDVTLGRAGKVVEAVEEGLDLHLVRSSLDGNLDSVPPGHVGGLDEEVVSHPARDGDNGDGSSDELLLPSNTDEHVPHLIADLVVALLLVSGSVGVHLVDSDDELLDTEKVEDTSVLAGLSLDLSGLGISLLDGGGEITVSGNHEKSDVSLGGSGDHVLDEISMARGVDDGVVPLVGEELLGGACDGHTTLTLLLLPVHVEGEGEGRLAEVGSLFLELLELTLGDTSKLEEETSSGGGLARVDMAADNDGKMLLLCHGGVHGG